MEVLVTGAAGHVGSELVAQLVNRGYRVRAGVRDAVRQGERLSKHGAEVVEVDLLDSNATRRAVAGVDAVFHVAAVFDLTAADPENAVVRPNVEMTRHVVTEASAAGDKKLILTSSVAAVGTTSDGGYLTEEDWNLGAREPYARSKALSEELAWDLAHKHGLNMVAILPGTVWGPGWQRPTASMKLLVDVIRGQVPMALDSELSLVDVRDLAAAHIDLLETPAAAGRYIATGDTWSMSAIHQELLRLDPSIKTSARVMPHWLAHLLPGLDWLRASLTGGERTVKRDLIKEYLGQSQRYKSARLSRECGWLPRPVRDTIADSLTWTQDYLNAKTASPQQRRKSSA
jgi:dihydroflavonol-4-reductase